MSAKALEKRMNKLAKRRADYDARPPLTKTGSPQQHGLNRKGNSAKRPGSMKP